MKNPWIKFFPTDWRADPALRMCSLAARGLWIEMLCIMHEAEGYLEINGHPLTERSLASLTGASYREVPELLGELELSGVFSKDRKGRIYSRRILRDVKKANTARINGKTGGNPTLSKQRGNSSSDNPKDKGGVKGEVKPQSPEARSQSKKRTNKLVPKKNDEPPEEIPKKPPKQDRGKRLPKDWRPTLADEEFAREEGLNHAEIKREADKFRDHYISITGSKATRQDWPATWRNWIRNDFQGRSKAGSFSPSGQRQGSAGRDQVYARVLDRAQEQDAFSQERGGSTDDDRRGSTEQDAFTGSAIEG